MKKEPKSRLVEIWSSEGSQQDTQVPENTRTNSKPLQKGVQPEKRPSVNFHLKHLVHNLNYFNLKDLITTFNEQD